MPGKLQKGRISALDTETIGGYAVILSTEHRAWEAHSFRECVAPIYQDIKKGNITSRIMMWNQGYDSQAILKYLPEDNIMEILQDHETLYDDRYHIKYVKGKFLQIRDRKLKTSISGYDIAQFYNMMPLDKAAKEYLGDKKLNNEVTETITTRSHQYSDLQLFEYFEIHKKEIMEYCKQDAVLTRNLGVYLSDKINEMYGFRLSRYTARTLIGKELIKRTLGKVKFDNGKSFMPYPKFMEDSAVAKMSTDAYHGGIFDCIQRGSFNEVTDIDISSAYPYHMRDLPNWSNGDFIQVWDDELIDTDKYGWMVCEFDYPLIPYQSEELNRWEEYHNGVARTIAAKNRRKYYPTGKRWAVITLVEYRFLKKYGYLLHSGEGYVWRYNSKKSQYISPFAWIDTIYKQKQQVKKELGKKTFQYALTKIPLNSAYGITAQKKGAAQFRNMFYASYITAATRIQICEMLEEIGYDRYISIATDGILLEGFVDLPERFTKKGLGSWDIDHWDRALVIANGIYQLEHKDKSPKIALRGMLSYKGDLKEAVLKHKDQQTFVPNTRTRPLTMYQSMKWNRYCKDDMNRFMPIGRLLSCNAETSKNWKYIDTFDSLLNGKYRGTRFTVDTVSTFK